jgi:hypothetical protein
MKFGIDVVHVLYEAGLISVTSKERHEFPAIHTSENRSLTNFETIQVQDRQNRP